MAGAAELSLLLLLSATTMSPEVNAGTQADAQSTPALASSGATVKADDEECAVVDVAASTATLHEAQQQARAAGASAPCVRVLLGQRVFRLVEPLVLSAADSHTTFVGGEITTGIDVPADAWNLSAYREVGTASSPVVASLEVSRLLNSTEWGKVAGSGTSGIGAGEHLSLLVQLGGIWRPMTVARWPNIPFDYGDVPPVNWTTISATCPCAGAPGGGCGTGAPSTACGVGCSSFQWADDTDRPMRWVTAAEEGRLFIHGFFKYLWRDHFAPITKVDVANRQLSTNISIGSTSGITNDSFYYAYGIHGEPACFCEF
jgi:hypothetical protein